MKRTSFHVYMEFNGQEINEVVIDQHYKIKHPEMSDDLILKLVNKFHKLSLESSKVSNGFSYFVLEPAYWERKPYRLIIVLEQGYRYLGVINAFRVKEKKNGITF